MHPDRDLERELGELGDRIDYPQTPDLARTVRGRLDGGDVPAQRRGWSPPRWAAAAAAFLLLIAVPALSPEVRDTAAGWFQAPGTGGAAGGAQEAVSTGDEATLMGEGAGPQAEASRASEGRAMPSSAGGARPAGGNLRYGEKIPLREAPTRLAGNEPLLPDLGQPDEVYAGGPSRKGGVVLLYRAERGLPASGGSGTGLVLTEVPGSVESAYFRGRAIGVAGIEEVSVGDGRGYWVPAGRGPSLTDRSVDRSVDRTGELPGNALFWERGGLALRLAADLPKEEMVRIAASVR